MSPEDVQGTPSGPAWERPLIVQVDHVVDASGTATLTDSSAQLLTLARSLTSGPVVAVSLTSSPDVAALGEQGAARVLVPDLAGRSPRVSAVVADAVLAAVGATGDVGAVLCVSGSRGREVAARLAVRLHSGAAVDVTAVDIVDGDLQASKTALAGTWSTRFHVTRGTPVIAVRPSAVEAVPAAVVTLPDVQTVPVDVAPDAAAVAVVSSTPQESESGADLAEAQVVVVGGRGTQGDFTPVRALAAELGGAVGATRVVTDEGWAPRSLQIGQTGVTVSPKVYIGLGVSGAIHHTAGMQSSQHIVAVCDDPDAPIFEIADFGVVGDLFEVVPQAIEALRRGRDRA